MTAPRCIVVGNDNDSIYEYALSTAFDASTAEFVDVFDVAQDNSPQGMAFSNDGAKMFVVGYVGPASPYTNTH